MSSVSVPICMQCWVNRYPGRDPYTLRADDRVVEQCAFCGWKTIRGIWVAVLRGYCTTCKRLSVPLPNRGALTCLDCCRRRPGGPPKPHEGQTLTITRVTD